MVNVIKNIYDNYFSLSKEELDKYISLVRSNVDFNDIEFIKTYISKFIPILIFTYDDNIKDDIVLSAVLNGKINDFKIMGHAISELDKKILIDYYGDDLSNFTKVLDGMSLTDSERVDIFNIALDDLITDYSDKVLEFILKDKTSKYVSCIDEQDKNMIIEAVCNTIPEVLDDSVINYILESGNWTDYFVLNLYESLNTVRYSDYTKNLIIEYYNKLGLKKLEDIPFDECANKLNQVINNDYQMSLTEIESIIRSLVRLELGINDFQVYFANLAGEIGLEYSDYNVIAVNLEIVEQFINMHISSDLVTILEIIFHECEHIKQAERINKEENSEEVIRQIKEVLLYEYNDSYYGDNYEGTFCEREARLESMKKTKNFMLKYIDGSYELLQELKYDNKIQDEINNELYQKVMFGQTLDYRQMFDYLVALKPGLVINNKLLQSEYNLDGTKKDSGKSIVKK